MSTKAAESFEKKVQYDDKEFVCVKEGLASILYPPSQEAASKGTRKDLKTGDEVQTVFYNPIQQFNRDLSVLAIKAFAAHREAEKKLRVEDKKRKTREHGCSKNKKRKREGGKEGAKEAQEGEAEKTNGPTNGDGAVTAERRQHVSARDEEPVRETEAENNGELANNEPANGDGPSTEQQQQASSRNREPGQEPEAEKVNIPTSSDEPAASQKQQHVPSFTVLDALSATGLRALRYASEVPYTSLVVANDLSSSAIQSMKVNIEYNKLQHTIQPQIGDARSYMYSLLNPPKQTSNKSYAGKFDVIDLDPYGTAAPFMDAAVQAVKEGGILCVTCTDAGVWASTGYPEKCFALYGGIPVKSTYAHEAGLRLILHALATSAARYGLAIEPLLSLSIDFYARVFVRIHKSPAEVKFMSGNTILVYNCDQGCGAWSTQPLAQTRTKLDKKGNPFYAYSLVQGPVAGSNCEHCGFRTHIGGPMWGGPLHNPDFIRKILNMLPELDRNTYQTVDRIEGVLTTALEEDLDLAASNKEPASQNPEINNNDTIPADHSKDAIIPRSDPTVREAYPFYTNLSHLAKVLHTQTMQIDAFRGALCHLGYRSTRSHAKPNTIRTDAPWDVIWEVMREWVRQKAPISESALRPGTACVGIMEKGREKNIPAKSSDKDRALSVLKDDLIHAAESGRDINDLMTKAEAALYRSGSSRVSKRELSNITTSTTNATSTVEPELDLEHNHQTSAKTSTEKPHPSTLNVVFDEALGREVSKANTKKRLVRYQMNPRANWGPLSRASGNQTT